MNKKMFTVASKTLTDQDASENLFQAVEKAIAYRQGIFLQEVVSRITKLGSVAFYYKKNECSILKMAVDAQYIDLIASLCGLGASVDRRLLISAIETDNVAILKLLLVYASDYEGTLLNSSPLQVAMQRSQHEMALMLLRSGSHPLTGCSLSPFPLVSALKTPEFLQTMLLFVGHEKRFEAAKMHVLLQAIKQGFSHQVEILLQAGFYKPEIEESIPLMEAIAVQNWEAAKILLSYGHKVEEVCPVTKKCSLHLVVEKKNQSFLHVLCQKAAKSAFTLKDRQNLSALHYAVLQGSTEIVELLLDAGADIEQRGGPRELSPLNMALSHKTTHRYEMALLLKERGAAMEPNHKGQTPYLKVRLWHEDPLRSVFNEKTDYEREFRSVKDVSSAIGINCKNVQIAFAKGRIFSMNPNGCSCWRQIKLLARQWLSFCQEHYYPVQEIADAILCECLDGDKKLERIKSGKPSFLSVGYDGHAMGLVFHKEDAMQNKGVMTLINGGPRPKKVCIEAWVIDFSKITIKLLEKLDDFSNADKKSSFHFFYDLLLKQVQAEPIALYNLQLQALNGKEQKYPNCSYYSVVRSMRYLHFVYSLQHMKKKGLQNIYNLDFQMWDNAVGQSRNVFKSFVYEDKKHRLQRYLQIPGEKNRSFCHDSLERLQTYYDKKVKPIYSSWSLPFTRPKNYKISTEEQLRDLKKLMERALDNQR